MRLVIDTNRVIAALVRDSTCRRIILSSGIRFVTVGLTMIEIAKYRDDILAKTGNTEEELIRILALLFEKIETEDDITIEQAMPLAKEMMDRIDKDDTKFIALALSTDNDGIWSDDRHFKMQNRITVWKTTDLLSFIE